MRANVRGHDEQEYIFGIDFWPYYRKKIKPTKFANFFVFYEFSGFPVKTERPISSQRDDIDGWFFYHKYNFSSSTRYDTFRSIQRHLCFFLGETPWNRTTGIITFFAINQEGVDQSFSSSNSTEISIRRFYVQNFITIGLTFEELSCKRPDGHTDRFYSVLNFWVHKKLTSDSDSPPSITLWSNFIEKININNY
jgi:hypothetical protein